MKNDVRVCTHCIMDTTDPDITFDERGVCCYCRLYERRAKNETYRDEAGQARLRELIRRVKEEGRDRKYDCVIGVSGGVDSSMVAYEVKKAGLRPLAVHLDNGWDTELAVGNIERLLKRLGIDLYTHVIDWEEFRDLQLSFLKASVINCEIPTDHAIVAILYRVAAREGIRTIFSGSNIATEAIMPDHWSYDSKDWRHIRAIQGRFGTIPLKTFPHLTLFHWVYYTFVKRIRFIPILNYLDYNKKGAIETLRRDLSWKNYEGKHFESVYTRFYQAAILPGKFNIDKRKAHLSTMICSGQITREEALREMATPPYTAERQEEDREYVIKKLGLDRVQFGAIMNDPPKSHLDYPNWHALFKRLNLFVKWAKKVATYN